MFLFDFHPNVYIFMRIMCVCEEIQVKLLDKNKLFGLT